MTPAPFYYAVAKGRKVGVFNSWPECQEQVRGFNGAKYKKFSSLNEAQAFASSCPSSSSQPSPPSESDATSKPVRSSSIPSSSSAAATKRSLSPAATATAATMGSALSCFEPASKAAKTASSSTRKTVSSSSSNDRKKELKELKTIVGKIGRDFERQAAELREVEARIDNLVRGEESPESDPPAVLIKKEGGGGDSVHGELRDRGFVVGSGGFVEVFTDGACSFNGNARLSKAGVGVWWNDGHPRNVGDPLPPGMRRTNNAAEIHAASVAIRIAKASRIGLLRVKTDSQFMINCVLHWMDKWKRNGWTTAKGDPVINKDELVALDDLLRSEPAISVEWEHVRGHVGIKGNEEADRLARAGADRS